MTANEAIARVRAEAESLKKHTNDPQLLWHLSRVLNTVELCENQSLRRSELDAMLEHARLVLGEVERHVHARPEPTAE